MSETIELTVKIPQKLHRALRWYAPLTSFWAGPQAEAEAVEALIVQAVQLFLEQEANNPQMAWDYAKAELATQLKA